MANELTYLDGALAPVSEEVTLTDLTVTGTLPADLDGRYLRNGPNPIAPDPDSYHWFLGDGMVHGIKLRDGRAEWYRNRWVRAGQTPEALGEPDPGGPVHGGMDFAVNTSVIGLAGRTFSIVEAGSFPVEMTEELDTVGRSDFDGTLTTSYTAHPKVHALTGDFHAITYWWPEESVHHVVVGPDARVKRDVEIPMDGRPMIHNLALSASRVAILDLPVQFDLDTLASGFPYHWVEDRQARVGLLPIDGSPEDVVWCEVDPCYVYHLANAVDLPDGSFQVEVARHPSTLVINEHGPRVADPTLVRWTVDPSAGKVREEMLDDLPVEFPRFDERRGGESYRYVYATNMDLNALGTDPRSVTDASVVRYDLDTGSSQQWQPGGHLATGEFVVVPRDGSTAEDDAWLIGLVLDDPSGTAALAVLAADDLEAGPVATVEIPVRVPVGFHGNWIPTT